MTIRQWLTKWFGDAFKKAAKTVPVIPDIIKPADPVTPSDPQVIVPDPAVRYSRGAKDSEYGEEIWIANWHRMNLRVHVNNGETQRAGIPIAGPWYPLAAHTGFSQHVTLTKTATGCTMAVKDFTSPGGQAYRMEGFFADGHGCKFEKVRTLIMSQAEMHGAVFIALASVEK